MEHRQKLAVDQPVSYRVQVQGAVSKSHCDVLGDLTLRVEEDGTRYPVTTITGEFLDQASLMGLVNFLYDRRLPLLLVEYIPKKIPEAPEE
jgi:hypothetical protein